MDLIVDSGFDCRFKMSPLNISTKGMCPYEPELYTSGGLAVKSCPTLANPQTVARQTVAPLSMEFPRQEY